MSSAVCVIFDCNIHIDVAERMLRRITPEILRKLVEGLR